MKLTKTEQKIYDAMKGRAVTKVELLAALGLVARCEKWFDVHRRNLRNKGFLIVRQPTRYRIVRAA